MSIAFQEEGRTFVLTTKNTTYQMQVDDLGYLRHLYYGRRVDQNLGYLGSQVQYAFSPNPHEQDLNGACSLDTMPQEYTGCNVGDYRISSLVVADANGAYGADLRYVSHLIAPGKYSVEGMPCAFASDNEAQTLEVVLEDEAAGLKLQLFYGVFEEKDMITRSAVLGNVSEKSIVLEKAASMCIDFPYGNWDLIHFHGRHAMERQMERTPLSNDIHTISSKRGASSHHHNPFVILADHGATEETGECYGMMLVYSGSFRTDIEKDQTGNVRVVMGIQDEFFCWSLSPGESFQTPEVLLSFTHEGLGKLSGNYHRFIRSNICKSPWSNRRRPVLLNTWEGTGFDFDEEKILEIAREASSLGVEMLVLDDGWFGARNDEFHGLGDWYVNEKKLPGGLGGLIEKINGMGLKFGLWVEPEMVNEDSDLYRQHPDWALALPNRSPALGRHQLVLDMSRPDVVDYLYDQLASLLTKNHIDYIKWDMNRNMSDVYSRLLPPKRQGEVYHRYILGVYSLLERLTTRFPDVLFEGCAGGGGRFDAGMLAYFPQIWCSDDTDAIERLKIQYGTTFGYPVSAIGSHVSACPNQQTGRTVPLETRAVAAMEGTFGYELDPTTLTVEEKEAVKCQIARFKRYDDLIRQGDYYRITNPNQNHWYIAWQFVSKDKERTLMNVVVTHPVGNSPLIRLRFCGLNPDMEYRLAEFDVFGTSIAGDEGLKGTPNPQKNALYSGAALMYGGIVLPRLYGDYPSVQIFLTNPKEEENGKELLDIPDAYDRMGNEKSEDGVK